MVCADGWWEEAEERMEMGCDEPGMVSMARWRAQGSVECDDGPGIYVTPRIDKRCESRSSSSLVEGGDGGQGRSDRVLICVPTYKVKLCNGDFWRFAGGVRVISFYN